MGWSGFRDVIEVDGRRIGDRRNRLQALFTEGSPDAREARRIADESARFNLGPARRNFNEPTATLFFMMPSTQSRFVFSRKGEVSIDGVHVWEIAFKETRRPTLIRTTDGRDVPSQARFGSSRRTVPSFVRGSASADSRGRTAVPHSRRPSPAMPGWASGSPQP
jgi:hypothetical protein